MVAERQNESGTAAISPAGARRLRLDQRLVKLGHFPDQASAERACLAGLVSVDGLVVTQAGNRPAPQADIQVRPTRRFVSRGGDKLQSALEYFGTAVEGKRCVDIGASSGGFTDCLLQNGALSVSAVDVAYGQFDWRLRNDSRVRLWERTDFAKMSPDALGAPYDLVVADLSFTSLARHVVALAALLNIPGDIIVLIKPQFELPKALVGNGVVRDSELHMQAIQKVLEKFREAGLLPQALAASQLLGKKGNQEFFLWAKNSGQAANMKLRT